jgi:hypothetical protein
LRNATRILFGESELKTPLGRLGCILSFNDINSELLSVIKYAVNKNRSISTEKNVEMVQKGKI